jgi:hypothetical protein
LPFAEANSMLAAMNARQDTPIYRDLMRFKPEQLTPNGWAVKAGVSRTVWADMRRHGNPSRRTLEKLLAAAGSSLAEFEALRLGPEPARQAGTAPLVGDSRGWGWTPAPLPPLPLVATALAGEWGEPASGIELLQVHIQEAIDRLPRPPSLGADPKAFAVTVVGDSMWPRFRPGRRVAVSPKAPIAVGDDVLVLLRRSNGPAIVGQPGLIKELVGRTRGFIELRQFKPDRTIRVDEGEVEAIHKIVGEIF